MTDTHVHPPMTEDEFRSRFIRAVIAKGFQTGELPFDRDPSRYAANVACSYWLVYLADGGTPEAYAPEEASFWGSGSV